MGTYNVWATTGEPDPSAATGAAQEIIALYDETENDIPGEWPGLSFDYCEVVGSRTVAEAVGELRAGNAPSALVTPCGTQIRPEPPGWANADEEYAGVSVTYGADNMERELLADPAQSIVEMEWHC